MNLRKLENKLDWFCCLINPFRYCYTIGFLIGTMIKEINNSIILFIKDMRR